MSDTFDRIITADSVLIDGVFVAASLGIRDGVIAAIVTGPDALRPDALGPNALGPDALGSDAGSPDALRPDALGPDALKPGVLGTGGLAGSGAHIRLPPDSVLLPGLVDTHVHVTEPGRTEWEGFTSATRAAAAGGVTTIIDMPLNSIPATVDAAALAMKRAIAARKAIVDVGFWGGAVPDSLGHLDELHDRGV
ncbi:MAG: amidohydrolase family protein, partial [Microbacteriaceae bacterium]|nr:amidohydrolase family protein [Microbacteriaceae bacterium]